MFHFKIQDLPDSLNKVCCSPSVNLVGSISVSVKLLSYKILVLKIFNTIDCAIWWLSPKIRIY